MAEEKNKSMIIQFNSDGERVDMIEDGKSIWSIDHLSDAIEVEDKLYDLMTLVTGAKRVTRITFPGIGALEDYNDV